MQHRLQVVLNLAALASVAVLAACGSDANQPDEIANVRVLNASMSAGPITANTEGRTISSNVAFQTSTLSGACGTIEKGGDEQIDFVAAGTTNGLGSVKANFVPQHNYTVVFYGPNNAIVYPDEFTNPATGNNAIRIINATGTAGDVFVTIPSASISGSPSVANLAAGAASGTSATATGGTFAQYPVANTRVRLFNVGQTTGTPRADFTIPAVPSNRVATVVLTPAPAGSSTTAFMAGTCAN